MYWPVGPPRIYATCNSWTKTGQSFEIDDNADLQGTREEDRSLVPVGSPGLNGQGGDMLEAPGESSAPRTPVTPKTPAIQPVEQDSQRLQSSPSNEQEPASYSFTGKEPLLSLKISRTGHLFAVITATSLTIWQTKPTAILAVVVRSRKSLTTYGRNISLLVRPDSAIFVVETTSGYLITYSLATDPEARVYRPRFNNNTSSQARRLSQFSGVRSQGGDRILWGSGEGGGVRDVSLRFRMVIKVDAGIGKSLALDDELVVATRKPAAVQCIRWTPDATGHQTSTELFSKTDWLPKNANLVEMIYDRPMNLLTWITSDGRAYAVQRLSPSKDSLNLHKLFRGYCFHNPTNDGNFAVKAAINARFSLVAVGCIDGTIEVYTARDYAGNIPSSHKHKPSVSRHISGSITCLAYSPDGYCLFAGYEQGWAMWSVFGKPGATSFGTDRKIAQEQGENWLLGVKEATWFGGGSDILMIGLEDDRIWTLEMGRSAITGCFASSNISRMVLQTTSSIMVYRGYDLPDLTTISTESSLWHVAQIPSSYLVDQWPVRCSVISDDGRYVAVAGRRGLAHYSINSGRWKTFVNENMENEFQVRGGMCWHQHILVAAIEAGDSFQLRLYSREAALDSSLVVHVETLPAPVVLITRSGEDSLLVYTYDNLLYHYVFTATSGSIRLMQVGQIAFHGIVRSPARVRGLSWILPSEQLLEGDPSQDVAVATVLFLVDGKLVLLQPSISDGKLKYDMRVIAQNVEYYALMRDSPFMQSKPSRNSDASNGNSVEYDEDDGKSLKDSLWYFDGTDIKLWTDVQDVLNLTESDPTREQQSLVSIPIDFYPSSILLAKGLILGLEPEIVQRRDVNFALLKFTIRTHLFVPQTLQFYLARSNPSAALHLAHQYQDLQYFAHSLEVLLHNVLDEEVDLPSAPENALLPAVLSLLSSFPQYLDIVVQCTRKTEVRSWRTLFAYLPPPQELFEDSMQRGLLKTAGGYLLILHTFEELSSSSEQLVRLLSRAKNEGDWELCKELARFLMALDETGATLREALEMVSLKSPQDERSQSSFMFQGSRLTVAQPRRELGGGLSGDDTSDQDEQSNGSRRSLNHDSDDYFSTQNI